jgi:hypothetical protein
MKFSVLQKYYYWFGLSLLGILYTVRVLLRAQDSFVGDESGYLEIAAYLSRGELPNINWWGPGYPLILTPFIIFQIPLIWAKLLNVAFLVATIFYIRLSLLLLISEKYSNRISLLMGIYFPFVFSLNVIISENFAIFLMSATIYHYLAIHEGKRKLMNFIIVSILLSLLALTKVFYGYVIASSLIIVLVVQLFLRNNLWITFLILLISLLLCLPYLWNNYKLSGKIFYWSTSGGLSLYWMSTPYAGETGSCFTKYDLEVRKPPVNKNHYEFHESLAHLNDIERDESYKRAAINNICYKPLKFLFNVFNNILRMLFGFPNDF